MGTDDEERRLQLEGMLAVRVAGRPSGLAQLPDPPIHIHGMDQLFFLCRYAEEDIRRGVPAEFTPHGSNWGLFSAYSAPYGWGVAPFTAFYSCFQIAGYDTPDGFPCVYFDKGYYSDRALDIWHRHFHPEVREGWSRISVSANSVSAVMGHGDTVLARAGGRFDGRADNPSSGINRYAAMRPGGGYHTIPVTFSCRSLELVDPFVEVTDAGRDAGIAQPLEVIWPEWSFDTSLTIGEGRPVLDAARNLEGDLRLLQTAELFGRVGWAAVVVDRNARVLRVNALAEKMQAAGTFNIDGRLRLQRREDDLALTRLIDTVAEHPANAFELPAIPVTGRHGRVLLAQAFPADPALAGGAFALVLITDPASTSTRSAAQVLQLLGLTPAEARLAAAIGGGMPPRDAANLLGITEGTARSSLKIVYDKLGIRKQMDLARIVTRLEGLA